ncbi:unnamed protein product [Cuscuta campestris]|uniref:F-box domain-containing protein n=1 Tax=Cuscuta campestris TaxID=132261 RepID=A0A484LDK8_9ASTE|nr:unnamed protein product [Cuscuta campestris]
MKRNEINKSGHRISIHDINGSTSCQGGLVEKLPVEVIGEILSCVGVARDVIRASLTCRKWREAYLKHLRTLSFNVADDDRVYRELPISDLEMLITETLYQSPGLRRLSILMDDKHDFMAATVVGWLMFARKNLTELFYKVRTSNPINVLATFGRQRLETFSLSDYIIDGAEPKFKPFPCLTSLSLTRVRISVEGLNRLLLAFPKLERAELSDIFLWALSDDDHSPEITVKLSCPTLKTLSLSYLQPMDLILENGGIEYLHVQRCCFGSFKVNGSKNLRHFNMSYTKVQVHKIEDGDNLESLEIISSDVTESNLFPMKINPPQLKTFRIWGTNIFVRGKGLVVDLQQLSVCSPQLSHLAIFYYEEPSYDFTFGSLEKVGVLEVGWEWDYIDGFFEWAEKVLKCCPNVGKLIVHGIVPKEALVPCPSKYLEDFGAYTSSMLETMRKYQHIQVQFVYKYQGEFSAYL